MSDSQDGRVAIKVVVNGQVREITFEQLVLSNNLAQEALVRLLVKKKLIDPNELVDEINAVQKERYRVGEPPK